MGDRITCECECEDGGEKKRKTGEGNTLKMEVYAEDIRNGSRASVGAMNRVRVTSGFDGLYFRAPRVGQDTKI